MITYLFYDLETTGLNKAFDQVLQFAAIRTDMNLKEIERHSIMIQLRPDVIYSPKAMITNRISIAESMKGVCEYEGTKQIHGLLNEFGTISIGYNTLGFDDEFLRFSFHRNLLPPYTHQYENGCYRMDLLPVTAMYWLYKKDVLTWPELNEKPTIKLEHLSAANKLAEGRAHDALVDVEATCELARRFSKEKKMWDYLAESFVKKIDAGRIAKLPVSFQTVAGPHCKGLMIGSEFGPDQLYQTPVLSIGNSIPYSNQTLWLRLDQVELQNTTSETIKDTTWAVRKRLGEPGIIIPPLDRYLQYLDKERCELVEDNIRFLQDNPDLFQEIIRYHQEFRYPEIPDLDSDAVLYQMGFLSRDDQELCRRFHAGSMDEKIKIQGGLSTQYTRELAARVISRNYSKSQTKTFSDDFKKFMEKVNPKDSADALCDYKGDKRTTPHDARLEISELRKENSLDDEQLTLLDELEGYLKEKF